jgi:hypothetical protein
MWLWEFGDETTALMLRISHFNFEARLLVVSDAVLSLLGNDTAGLLAWNALLFLISDCFYCT